MTMIKTGWTAVKGLWSNESGQGLVEYALILALVSIVCMVLLGMLGSEVGSVFDDVISALQSRNF